MIKSHKILIASTILAIAILATIVTKNNSKNEDYFFTKFCEKYYDITCEMLAREIEQHNLKKFIYTQQILFK
jgi:hypothetical protein